MRKFDTQTILVSPFTPVNATLLFIALIPSGDELLILFEQQFNFFVCFSFLLRVSGRKMTRGKQVEKCEVLKHCPAEML